MTTFRTIVFATDFAECSQPAFDLACALARDYGAELRITHISPEPIIAVADGMTMEIPSGMLEETEAKLKAVRPADPAVKYTHRLARGDVAAEIVRVAADGPADLIVMGTHGRSGIGRMILGSVAEAVLRHAPCPVMTVKPRGG